MNSVLVIIRFPGKNMVLELAEDITRWLMTR